MHQQIKCIDKSLTMFSNQDMEEALRIATSLRVLLHNTQNSTSLFHQLELDKNFWMFDNSKQHDPNDISVETLLMDFVIDPRNPHWIARTQIDSIHTPKIEFSKWWNNPVITCGVFDKHKPYSRKDVILKLANWEGGAHVGNEIEQHYWDLTRNNHGGSFLQFGNSISYSGSIMFYLTCTAIAHEFLVSCLFQIPNLSLKSIIKLNSPPKPIPNLLTKFSIKVVDKK